MEMTTFKNTHAVQDRLNEARLMIEKYPNRIPIIVEASIVNRETPSIDKNKYLVPRDLTLGQFLHVIRRRLEMHDSEALFLQINGKLLPCAQTIEQAYDDFKDEDGFLYVTYCVENTFGGI